MRNRNGDVENRLIQEALFLDDPSSRRLDIADVKSSMRMERSVLRCPHGEELPGLLPSDTTPRSFLPAGRFARMKDILAVMKRCVTFVFTESALCVRLPSECHDAIVHRITKDNMHLDLLALKDKHLYGSYKNGVTLYGPNHAAEVAREQSMIGHGVERMAQFFTTVKKYVEDCDCRHGFALFVFFRPLQILLNKLGKL